MLKINVDIKRNDIPSKIIAFDMGQSLTKIAYADENRLNLVSLSTQSNVSKLKEIIENKKNKYPNFNFTGGRCFTLFRSFSEYLNTKILNEFEATVKGIDYLYSLEKSKNLLSSLVVTMGTGTSILLKNETYKHLGGTAMGGGFFMGLIKQMFDLNDFQEAVNLAKNGDRYNVDLKVSDIYDSEDNRIDLVFREFTAASFGKINNNFDRNSLKKEDFINSLICVIGENIGTIANLMAENNGITDIIFSGGFLRENRPLRKILSLICKVNKKKAIFLKNSEFSAAIGALLL